MPGVPSGRGCDACINQKKKCDQLKPTCSRCSRLRIPCIGNGKQRFKFKVVIGGSEAEARQKRLPPMALAVTKVDRSLSNVGTSILDEFVHKLEVTDLRYDVCGSFGALFKAIPKRFGTNAALDASVCALTTVLSSLSCVRQPPKAYARYGYALTALKDCLEDPIAIQSSSTVCAIYLIWICQSLIAFDEEIASGHGAAIVKLLARAPYRHSQDEFDHLVLTTIAGPVLFEGLFDPTVKLNPWLRQLMLETEKPVILDNGVHRKETGNEQPHVGGFFACVARFPEFIQFNPALHEEIVFCYRGMQQTSMKLHEKVIEARKLVMKEIPTIRNVTLFGNTMDPERLHAFYHRIYALFLMLEMLLNGVLRKYSPSDEVLHQESLHISQQIIEVSLAAVVWKPLGAGWTLVCLISAWAATFDADRKAQIERTFLECCSDYTKRSLASCAVQLENLYGKLGADALRIAQARRFEAEMYNSGK